MKTILVLSQHPALPEGIRAVLNPEQYRVISRLDVEEAEPLLDEGLVNTCILDVEFTNVQAIWAIEKLRRRLPRCPLLLYTGTKPWEWEEEAYLKGVSHILTKPARGRTLNALLERLGVPAPTPLHPQPPRRPEVAPVSAAPPAPFRALEALRDFSAVLTHSLHADAMLKQFLLLLREIIGVNRAAIFLRPRPEPAGALRALLRNRHRRLSLSPGPHFAPPKPRGPSGPGNPKRV